MKGHVEALSYIQVEKNTKCLVFCANFDFGQRSCLGEKLFQVAVFQDNVSALLLYTFAFQWYTKVLLRIWEPDKKDLAQD